jgi:UDP-N-acetylmuramate dehydrogenase
MPLHDEFGDILRSQEPLAPYTHLRLGGPAQLLAQPRSIEELAKLVQRCAREGMPWRILGGGCNILVRDEGVRGVVIRLGEPAFTAVENVGRTVKAGGGATLASLISHAARQGLAGTEALIGIPGTVGGGLRVNAGSRYGAIDQLVSRVHLLDTKGQVQLYQRSELTAGPQGNFLDDGIILAVEFDLEPDEPENILKRMRRFWIHKKAQQPLSFQRACRVFKEPRGLSAEQLIQEAELKGTRVGGAEVSDRNANYIVAHPGATARDVLRLIELMRSRVHERTGQLLQLEVTVW